LFQIDVPPDSSAGQLTHEKSQKLKACTRRESKAPKNSERKRKERKGTDPDL